MSLQELAGLRCRAVVRFVGVLVTIVLSCQYSCGGVIVEIPDTDLSPGGFGTIDVVIRAEGDQTIDLANYGFQISNVGAPTGSLEFVNPQPFTEFDDSDYLFSGDSSGLILTTTLLNPFLVTGSDLTLSGAGTSLLSGQERLLVRLAVQHTAGPGSLAGDQFQIRLVSPPDTFFLDELGNDMSVNPLSFQNALITTVAAVPEPSASLSLLSLTVFGLIRRRRKT